MRRDVEVKPLEPQLLQLRLHLQKEWCRWSMQKERRWWPGERPPSWQERPLGQLTVWRNRLADLRMEEIRPAKVTGRGRVVSSARRLPGTAA